MAIYYIPGAVRHDRIKTGHLFADGSSLLGDTSDDAAGFGGDAAAASTFVDDVTATDADVITALGSIVDSLQAHGIMGAS